MTETEQFLSDILCTAIEGGIGYWARAYNVHRDADGEYLAYTLVEWENVAEDLDLGFFWSYGPIDDAVLADPDRWPQYTVTLTTLELAYRKMLSAYILDGTKVAADDYMQRFVQAWAEKDAGILDANDADVLVQVAAMGEVVYG